MIPPEASAGDILEATGGILRQGSAANGVSSGVSTDSRRIIPGCCFVALKGERFDGNAYAARAAAEGASVVVVSRMEGVFPSDCAVIEVPDTLAALQGIADWWRNRLDPIRVIGVTGSSGKTSTKDMLRGVLQRRGRASATQGNLNNHIGVPLSILSTPRGTQTAIWEIGMNHPGELSPLCRLIRPCVGVITSIGSAHIEFFRSRRAIAEEKCTIARMLPAHGCVIYPADCEFADLIASSTVAECVPVGMSEGRVRAEHLRMSLGGCSYDLAIEGHKPCPVFLPVPGVHMAADSLLAAAAAWKLGLSPEEIAESLRYVELTSGRLRVLESGGMTVIDDSYNANPESMRASLSTLASLPVAGRRIAVLGQMGELGEAAREAHFSIGAQAAFLKIDLLCVVGEGPESAAMLRGARGIDTAYASDPEAAAELLRTRLHAGDALLFKASHAVGISRCMHLLFPSLS